MRCSLLTPQLEADPMATRERGLGKCTNDHVSSYGFPTRPVEPFPFCSRCGAAMLWGCVSCETPMPEDHDELILARFCRECGAGYFGPAAEEAAAASTVDTD